jgi:hypothetical protein
VEVFFMREALVREEWRRGAQCEYRSTVESTVLPRTPPETRSLPLGSSVAVWFARGALMVPAALQVPEAGW